MVLSCELSSGSISCRPRIFFRRIVSSCILRSHRLRAFGDTDCKLSVLVGQAQLPNRITSLAGKGSVCTGLGFIAERIGDGASCSHGNACWNWFRDPLATDFFDDDLVAQTCQARRNKTSSALVNSIVHPVAFNHFTTHDFRICGANGNRFRYPISIECLGELVGAVDDFRIGSTTRLGEVRKQQETTC